MAASSPPSTAGGSRKRRASGQQVTTYINEDAARLTRERLEQDIEQVVGILRTDPAMVLPTLSFLRKGREGVVDEFPRGVRSLESIPLRDQKRGLQQVMGLSAETLGMLPDAAETIPKLFTCMLGVPPNYPVFTKDRQAFYNWASRQFALNTNRFQMAPGCAADWNNAIGFYAFSMDASGALIGVTCRKTSDTKPLPTAIPAYQVCLWSIENNWVEFEAYLKGSANGFTQSSQELYKMFGLPATYRVVTFEESYEGVEPKVEVVQFRAKGSKKPARQGALPLPARGSEVEASSSLATASPTSSPAAMVPLPPPAPAAPEGDGAVQAEAPPVAPA